MSEPARTGVVVQLDDYRDRRDPDEVLERVFAPLLRERLVVVDSPVPDDAA